MPPFIKRLGRSSRDAVKWKCGVCKRVNRPTKHLIFDLPKFRCPCGKKFEEDFHCCLSEVKVNGRLLLGDIQDQGSTEHCVAFAFAHQLEITLRLKALLKKRNPLSVKKLCGHKLFYKFKKRCKDYFPKKKSIIKKRAYIKQVHMGLILKEEGLENEDDQVCKVSNVSTIPRDDFEGIAKSIADGDSLVSSFNSGKRLSELKYGQIYKAYSRSRYRDNKKKKLTGHAVCLIGVGRKKGKPYCTFVNSWKKFCVRRNRRGKKYKWGVGRIRASDLKCSAIRLSRFSEAGDDRSLQPQQGTVLNEHNLGLMMASSREIKNELEINVDESDDDCESLVYTMIGSLTDKSKLEAEPELFINIVPDKTMNRLALIDSGISRTKSDPVNLGTVAMCGMKVFMEALSAGADELKLGQFCPDYPAQRIVVTIKYNDCEQCVWESQTGGSFSITHDTGLPILKVHQLVYLEVLRLISNQKPTLIRKPEDNTNEEYTAFYKSSTNDWEEHLVAKYFSVEGQLEFKAILLVRKRDPFSLFDTRKKVNNIKNQPGNIMVQQKVDQDCQSDQNMHVVTQSVQSSQANLNITQPQHAIQAQFQQPQVILQAQLQQQQPLLQSHSVFQGGLQQIQILQQQQPHLQQQFQQQQPQHHQQVQQSVQQQQQMKMLPVHVSSDANMNTQQSNHQMKLQLLKALETQQQHLTFEQQKMLFGLQQQMVNSQSNLQQCIQGATQTVGLHNDNTIQYLAHQKAQPNQPVNDLPRTTIPVALVASSLNADGECNH